MTNPITSSSYGTLDRTLAAISTLQGQIGTLQEQTTTGRVAQSYAGLTGVSSQVLDLTAATSRATAYDQVIANTQGRAAVIQNVLGQIGSIVGSVSTAALSLAGTTSSSTVSSAAVQAKEAFTQIASLLNTQYEGSYLFSGADSSNPPVPSPESVTSSGLYTQIGAAVAALATIPTMPALGTVLANTVAIASSTNPATSIFSSYLLGAGATTAPARVQVSDTQSVCLAVKANANASGIVSDPAINGTGSAISDILRGLAVVANSTATTATNPDFSALVRDAASTLSSANNTLMEQSGAIGQIQATLTSAASESASFQLVLAKQLSSLTDVDPASTISKLQAVSAQLQASYKVVSLASSLNLASYL